MNFGQRVLHTPAGKCPVKLSGVSEEEIKTWVNLVLEDGKQKNLVYLPSAILYFCQQFYNIFSDEYRTVKECIEKMFVVNDYNSIIQNEKKAQDEIKKEDQDELKAKKSKIEAIQNKPSEKKKRGRPPKNK